MRIPMILLMCAFARSASADAALDVKEYQAVMAKADEAAVVMVKGYVTGTGVGIVITHFVMVRDGNAPMFCGPQKLILDQNNYLTILDREIADRATWMKKEDLAAAPVAIILLDGLISTFPCNKK